MPTGEHPRVKRDCRGCLSWITCLVTVKYALPIALLDGNTVEKICGAIDDTLRYLQSRKPRTFECHQLPTGHRRIARFARFIPPSARFVLGRNNEIDSRLSKFPQFFIAAHGVGFAKNECRNALAVKIACGRAKITTSTLQMHLLCQKAQSLLNHFTMFSDSMGLSGTEKREDCQGGRRRAASLTARMATVTATGPLRMIESQPPIFLLVGCKPTKPTGDRFFTFGSATAVGQQLPLQPAAAAFHTAPRRRSGRQCDLITQDGHAGRRLIDRGSVLCITPRDGSRCGHCDGHRHTLLFFLDRRTPLDRGQERIARLGKLCFDLLAHHHQISRRVLVLEGNGKYKSQQKDREQMKQKAHRSRNEMLLGTNFIPPRWRCCRKPLIDRRRKAVFALWEVARHREIGLRIRNGKLDPRRAGANAHASRPFRISKVPAISHYSS